MVIFLMFIILFTSSMFANIVPYPSGIKVSFEATKKIKKDEFLIQKESFSNSQTTSRFLRIINGVSDIPKGNSLGIVFFNEKGKIIKHIAITNTAKPDPNSIFFIDRNSGRQFQGFIDIYSFPKKAETFSIGIINKSGKLITPLSIPKFDKKNQLSIDFLESLDSKKSFMWQIEISGTIKTNISRLNAFYFI